MPLDAKCTSSKSPIYCIYCQDQLTGELASFEEVRQGSIDAAIRLMGKSREEAEKMADALLPNLPRWRKSN
jgi:hypothetical protein